MKLNKKLLIYIIASIVWTAFHTYNLPKTLFGFVYTTSYLFVTLLIVFIEVFILLLLVDFVVGWMEEKNETS